MKIFRFNFIIFQGYYDQSGQQQHEYAGYDQSTEYSHDQSAYGQDYSGYDQAASTTYE